MYKTCLTTGIVVALAIGWLLPSKVRPAGNSFAVERVAPDTTVPTVDLRVTLLGTATHGPRPDRFGASTLVEAGPERLVFDCGRSCTTRLWQLKIPLGTVKLFITHLHADHTTGIPDLWLTGWLPMPYGGRKEPLRVWGPKGTGEMMSHMEKAYLSNVQSPRSFTVSGAQVGIDAKEISEGVVFDENGVRVTAFKVTHGEIEAFGYRVDYKGRSVVISGDMSPNENFIKYAQGADVVIHEVAAARPDLLEKSPSIRKIIANHCTPEEAGRDFTRIKPRLAVYTHFALFSDEGIGEVSIPELISRTRAVYSGPLEAGEDLTDACVVKRGNQWWMYLAGQAEGSRSTDLYSASLPPNAPLAAP